VYPYGGADSAETDFEPWNDDRVVPRHATRGGGQGTVRLRGRAGCGFLLVDEDVADVVPGLRLVAERAVERGHVVAEAADAQRHRRHDRPGGQGQRAEGEHQQAVAGRRGDVGGVGVVVERGVPAGGAGDGPSRRSSGCRRGGG
jgi:hypothetical protein